VTPGYDSNVFAYDSGYTDGIAYKRTGDGPWTKLQLSTAMGEIATAMVTARAVDATGWVPGSGKYNSKSVAFFGSSHMNNESNYLYRKLIANFGTSNVEHQARI
jgi:anaerobic selenocysteine-containing dehydrogenase